jgi:hypothetical protein
MTKSRDALNIESCSRRWQVSWVVSDSVDEELLDCLERLVAFLETADDGGEDVVE